MEWILPKIGLEYLTIPVIWIDDGLILSFIQHCMLGYNYETMIYKSSWYKNEEI